MTKRAPPYFPPRPKHATMRKPSPRRWPPDSDQNASENPAPVQAYRVVACSGTRPQPGGEVPRSAEDLA